MKKLIVSAMCIVLLFGCKKEYTVPPSATGNLQKKDVPICGNDLNPEFAAKMMKARKSRDEQLKLSTRKPRESEREPKPTVIFLDADGHTVQNTIWNLLNNVEHPSIVCSSAGLTPDQMKTVIASVREDFSPFHVVVTADENLFNNTPKERRLRVIVTPIQNLRHVFPYAGGYAAVGSLWWKDDTPSFVFSDVFFGIMSNLAQAVSHEAGHMIGLHHQSEYYADGTLKYEYHQGFFIRPSNIFWKPIMGTSYYADLSGWMIGKNFLGIQNDIEILGSIGFKPDVVPSTIANMAQFIFTGIGRQVKFDELINKPGDVDFYYIHSGNIKFSVAGFGNCDIKLIVYNGSRQKIAEFNDQNSVSISEKTIRTKGNRLYLRVEANDLLPNQIQSAGQYTLVVKKA